VKALVGVQAMMLWQLPYSALVMIWVTFLQMAVVQQLQRLPEKEDIRRLASIALSLFLI
jgi:cytochrome b subunit of formate dehydrogenase